MNIFSPLGVWRAALGVFSIAVTTSCQDPPSAPVATRAPSVRRVEIPDFSLDFEIPIGWIATPLPSGWLFAGPQGEASFFTTIIVQPRPTRASLHHAFEAMITPVAERAGFAVHRRALSVVAGSIALDYALSFELHDATRYRIGMFVPTPDGIVDVALAANRDLLVQALPIYDRVVSSLMVTERSLRDLSAGEE